MTADARLGDLSTATISDALDRLGIAGQAEGIRAVGPDVRCAGPAFTVRLVPITGTRGSVGDFIDEVPTGAVVVLDNGGRTDVTVWGDLLTETAGRRGLVGTVIHGACRDGARIRELGYPVFSRATYMRTGKGRVRAVDRQVPISVGTAAVEPDDRIVADADGVVVVPAGRAAEVLEVALEVDAAEDRIRRAVRSGASLADARRRVGYHDLQTARHESG